MLSRLDLHWWWRWQGATSSSSDASPGRPGGRGVPTWFKHLIYLDTNKYLKKSYGTTSFARKYTLHIDDFYARTGTDAVTPAPLNQPISASGGTKFTSGSFTYHIYTSSDQSCK